MVKTTVHYPGDPVEDVILMFGAEFVQHIRGGKPGRITVSTMNADGTLHEEHTSEIDDVICDGCNTSIALTDPCALFHGRLNCWRCHTRHFAAHQNNDRVQVGR